MKQLCGLGVLCGKEEQRASWILATAVFDSRVKKACCPFGFALCRGFETGLRAPEVECTMVVADGGTGNAGVEQFAREQRRMGLRRHDHGEGGKFRALRFVDGHGKGCFKGR